MSEEEFLAGIEAWQRKYPAGLETLEASWELAAIEESYGDTLFAAADPEARPHFLASQRALMPLGVRFEDRAENDRRMEAFQRLVEKLASIGPDGRPRNWTPPPPPEPPVPAPVPPALAPQDGFPKLPQGDDPWASYQLANQWREAAASLAETYPDDARRAYQWSIHFFERYNKLWTAHLPASRWDSDGNQEMADVETAMRSLPPNSANSAVPEWVDDLLGGQWQRSLKSLGDSIPPSEFAALAKLLESVRRVFETTAG